MMNGNQRAGGKHLITKSFLRAMARGRDTRYGALMVAGEKFSKKDIIALHMWCRGADLKELARVAGTTIFGAKARTVRLMLKTNTHSKVEMLWWAVENGVIRIDVKETIR